MANSSIYKRNNNKTERDFSVCNSRYDHDYGKETRGNTITPSNGDCRIIRRDVGSLPAMSRMSPLKRMKYLPSSTNHNVPIVDINGSESKTHKNRQMADSVSHFASFISRRYHRFMIIVTYVCMWAFFYIIVHHYQPQSYESASFEAYRPHDTLTTSALFLTLVELIKLLVSVVLHLSGPQNSMNDIYMLFGSKNTKVSFRMYLPVAVLYAIYNNLMFLNLKNNEPTFYLIMSSSRLVMTTILWQKVFNTPIVCLKKIAIVIITLGIFSKDMFSQGTINDDGRITTNDEWTTLLSRNGCSKGLIIVLQMLCSVFASIFNERLLKNIDSSQHLQNICLYINSVAINAILGVARYVTNEKEINFTAVVDMILVPVSLIIISILSLIGILTSTILRYENSVTKGVASASETVLTSMIEYLYFGERYKISEIFGILLVSAGTLIYSIPPELVKTKGSHSKKIKKWCLPIGNVPKRLLIFLLIFGIIFSHLPQISPSVKRHENKSSLCTKTAHYRILPDDITKLKYERVAVAENIVTYIITELNKVNAPVCIMYGTLLHEYRNGTGPCVQTNHYDKDFDIAVFPAHFDLIVRMAEDISHNFGWRVLKLDQERLFLCLAPMDQKRAGRGFQIDIYGFQVNKPIQGLIHFPWDKVTISAQSFLPMVKHKTIPYDSSLPLDDGNELFFHKPFNVPCLLENMYGSDYMTPKKGHFIRQTAHSNPICTKQTLTGPEQAELDRQLAFAGLNVDADSMTDGSDIAVQHHGEGIEDMSPEIGIISCIQTREDVISALELAHSFNNLTVNDRVYLELYHHMTLSPYLTANLEILGGNIRVIQLKQSPKDLNSCVRDALSQTTLNDALLIEPSFILVSYNPRQTLAFTDVVCRESTSGRVVSTSQNLDVAILFFIQSRRQHCKFYQASFYVSNIQKKSISKQEIMLNKNSTTIGMIYISDQISFISPTQFIFEWPSYYLDSSVLYCTNKKPNFERCDTFKTSYLLTALRRYRDWESLLLLDRQVGWIAFDGGLVLSGESNRCYSFNSVNGAKTSIEAINSDGYNTMVNVDLVMTKDDKNIAMHSYSSFNPLSDNIRIQKSPSRMTLSELQKILQHPCLSRDAILQWLDENPYRSLNTCHGCWQEISTAESFLDEIALKGNSSLIFDLKATGRQTEGLMSQAETIAELIHNKDRDENDIQQLVENVHLRFFAEGTDGRARLEVLPIEMYGNVTISTKLRQLKVYANAPSKQTCLQMIHWSRRNQNNKINLAGCFVVDNHSDIQESWKTLSQNLNMTKSLAPLPYETKIICDVPREQIKPNLHFWKREFIACVENGYEWIHTPFPVGSKSNYSPSASSTFFSVNDRNGDIIQSILSSYIQNSQSSILLLEYESHWGITSPYNWLPRKQQWSFIGSNKTNSQIVSNDKMHIFRCVTKILTVMMFLRLEELELVSLDDLIVGAPHNVTWRQVFTNTAGIDGSHAGKRFEYSNSLWSHVPNFVHNVTGVSFTDAIKYYVLDPIGLSGVFDTNSSYPPYAARGFLGSTKDILLIGSTLASGGISPETRLRVLSQSSVRKMLKDWTNVPSVSQSFKDDKTVLSMSRFYNNTNYNDDPLSVYGVVDGYGMGLWRVNGWRTRKGSIPVRGWLAMGSSETLLYFDEDDIVLGMCAPNRTLGLELTAVFASTVRAIGIRIDESFRDFNSAKERENHQTSIMKKFLRGTTSVETVV